MSTNEVLISVFYRIMWTEFSSMDDLYEDYIIHLIGTKGLNTLLTDVSYIH